MVAALSPRAAAEYTPPPTLADLLQADCAAVGRFVVKSGATSFVPERVLWGEARVIDDLPKGEDSPLRVEANGTLTAWVWGGGRGYLGRPYPEDAARRAIWLFFGDNGYRQLAILPAVLAPDVLALRSGKEPSAVFRLLQGVDFDMYRDALEDLFAGRDEDLLASLHRVALDEESLAALDAVDVLVRTRLLDVDRFWGRWTDHPASHVLRDLLSQRDADRVARELRKAVVAEKRPAWLDSLLYLAHEDVDLNIRHLDHAAGDVRHRALGNLYGRLWQLAREPGKDSERDALARRLLPLLKARREVETSPGARRTLDKMLKEEDGVPWVLRVPSTVEPPPPYSEAEERKAVISLLTSPGYGQHGFVMDSAGREIKEHFFAEGFERLKAAAASPDYNTPKVYEGMGYLRHPSVFAYLADHAESSGVWHAIGLQNHERSFDVLKERIESWRRTSGGLSSRAACDALGALRDPRALTLLKELEGAISKGHARLPYLRARLAHGDPWALRKLLAALREWPGDPGGVIRALLLSDAAEATDALRRHVRDAWPSRWESFDEAPVSWCLRMQNYAGTSRRTTALGELARRDPRWLAELALQKMESPSVSARICAAYIFRGLTGRALGFRPEAFASERAAPLEALQRWWTRHRAESREQWLLSYFQEKGFPMTRLHDRSSLPVLVRALAADTFTHGLAIEQVSVITGKYFGNYAQPKLRYGRGATVSIGGGGYAALNQERASIRVIGWLTARNLLPKDR